MVLALRDSFRPPTFHLRGALESAEAVRVRRGHVHLIVWDYGPKVPYLSNFRRARAPLSIRARELTATPLEGFQPGHLYAIRTVTLGGELLEVVVDFGPKPVAPDRLRELNRLLATLRVRPPTVVRAHNGRLARDGIALRLFTGWSGRLEVPADTHAVRVVFRAKRGDVHVVLLELPRVGAGYAPLPIALTSKNIIRRPGRLIARRVFSNGGRDFDLSVVITSARELADANRLLATMTVAPRTWTFRSCDLTLRLPGTWRAGVNPRYGCYPVIRLRGQGIRIVLTELRPKEVARGRILHQAGRRFQVQVSPPTVEATANQILATLRAAPRR